MPFIVTDSLIRCCLQLMKSELPDTGSGGNVSDQQQLNLLSADANVASSKPTANDRYSTSGSRVGQSPPMFSSPSVVCDYDDDDEEEEDAARSKEIDDIIGMLKSDAACNADDDGSDDVVIDKAAETSVTPEDFDNLLRVLESDVATASSSRPVSDVPQPSSQPVYDNPDSYLNIPSDLADVDDLLPYLQPPVIGEAPVSQQSTLPVYSRPTDVVQPPTLPTANCRQCQTGNCLQFFLYCYILFGMSFHLYQ